MIFSKNMLQFETEFVPMFRMYALDKSSTVKLKREKAKHVRVWFVKCTCKTSDLPINAAIICLPPVFV